MASTILLLGLLCLLPNVLSYDKNYSLNTSIVPSLYKIEITPYFETNDDTRFTFNGRVTITFITTESIKQIKLHAVDLNITATDVEVSTLDKTHTVALNATVPLEFNKTYDFVFINLQEDLIPNKEYDLSIKYTGPIREDLSGFYRNHYRQNGEVKWLGATQMEPTHARKVFPSFDEPGLKAVFQLSIDRPANYQPSLSNTEILETMNAGVTGYIREVFYPTPKMPTYLVAFLVSEFEPGKMTRNGTREFGVYSRPDAKNQTDYAFEFGQKVEKALSDYFGIDYYSSNEHLRLDHVALPDFNAGAMENWGLIKYREYALLYVPEVSVPTLKYKVASIVAHETTHMWFGNRVTCHWWSDIWLNEGFANYFENYITSLVEPELGSANDLVVNSVYSAYDVDATSIPISYSEVDSPAKISAHFDQVSYSKAGSVIRMMHHLIGDSAFKYGLNVYLRNNSFSSGYPDLLYASLQEGVTTFGSLSSYPGATVADVMKSWIVQAGLPLVHVDVDYGTGTVVLTQKRFYQNTSLSSNELYKIPITYTTEVATNFGNTKPAFIMENMTYQFNIPIISQTNSWVILNLQETGLYRVNYDDHSWSLISAALKKNRNSIHPLNRAKIINDLFALVRTEEVPFSLLYDVLDYLPAESEFVVWKAALNNFEKLYNDYVGDSEALPYIQNYILKLLNMAVDRVGFETKDTDSFEDIKNRMQILTNACKLDHKGCVEKSVSLFKGLKDNGVEVPPSLRAVVYCTGLRYGNAEDYNFLWERLNNTNVAAEAQVITEALSCTSDGNSLKTYLISRSLPGTPIGYQNNMVPLSSTLSNHTRLGIVLDSLNTNYSIWASIYSNMSSIVGTVAGSLRSNNDIKEFETWLSSCTECNEATKKGAEAVITKVRENLILTEKHKPSILNLLKNNSNIIHPSILMIVLFSILVSFNSS